MKKILFELSFCFVFLLILMPTLKVAANTRGFSVDDFWKGVEISDLNLKETEEDLDKRKALKAKDLIRKYEKNKSDFKILIVPGHDEEFNGAVFRNLKESQINLELATELEKFFRKEKDIEVEISRDRDGYHKPLQEFFDEQESEIKKFMLSYKLVASKNILNGFFETNQTVDHNRASSEMIYKLYGINLWANENDYDLVIHVHFNDYVGRYWANPGIYNGFSIYVPEKELKNHPASFEVAKSVAGFLDDYFLESNMPLEKETVIESQELIAIGANQTLNPASILIEYDYLYEDQYQHQNLRAEIVNEMAYRTYLGVMNFLKEENDYYPKRRPESFLIREIENDVRIFQKNSDIISLQAFLKREGFYDCQITGYFGKCTLESVRDFQKKQRLFESGFVGEEVREIINRKIKN